MLWGSCLEVPAQTRICTIWNGPRERRTVRWKAATWPERHAASVLRKREFRVEAYVVLGDIPHRDRSSRQAYGERDLMSCVGVAPEERL
jgi:hypothetical protein